MFKYLLTSFTFILLISTINIPQSIARDHRGSITCDTICEAEVICGGYVQAFPADIQENEAIFYEAIDETNNDLVEGFCVWGEGLIITTP